MHMEANSGNLFPDMPPVHGAKTCRQSNPPEKNGLPAPLLGKRTECLFSGVFLCSLITHVQQHVETCLLEDLFTMENLGNFCLGHTSIS